MKRVVERIQRLERYVLKPWYPFTISFLAAVDHLIFVVPTDGLLITSVFAAPKRWIILSFWLCLGSTLGAVVFCGLIEIYGNPFLVSLLPEIHQSHLWQLSDKWIDSFGVWALFFMSLLPLFQHPILAVAALADLPLSHVACAVFAGRLIKYFIISWLASHAPRLLYKIAPIRHEIEEIELDSSRPE